MAVLVIGFVRVIAGLLEGLGDELLVLEGFIVAEFVGVADVVLEACILLVMVGEAELVLDVDIVEVDVFVDIDDGDLLGEAVGVLLLCIDWVRGVDAVEVFDVVMLRVPVIDAVVVFVDVEESERCALGNEDREITAERVELFEDVALSVRRAYSPANTLFNECFSAGPEKNLEPSYKTLNCNGGPADSVPIKVENKKINSIIILF